MLFSAKAEYACVAMMELASRHGDPRPVRLTDIADKHGISSRFLVQILLQLKGRGWSTAPAGRPAAICWPAPRRRSPCSTSSP